MNEMIWTKGLTILLAICIIMGGCMEGDRAPTSSQKELSVMEEQQQKLIDIQPTPSLSRSLERENIANRLKMLDDQNKVFYIYLINYGKVMAFYTTKGKVTSLNTYMTPMERVIQDEGCMRRTSGDDKSGCYFTTPAPDQDGTYGENDDAVFFFTTEGAYVEWHGDYMVSDFPLRLSTPPELVMMLNETA